MKATAMSSLGLLAIGGSTGVIEALGKLLPALAPAIPCPVVVVVHVPPRRPSLLAGLFRDRCTVPVSEVEDKEILDAAHIYFAPPDYHVLVERRDGGRAGATLAAALSIDAPVHYSRPSIDVLFESVAWACGAGALAIALTGANQDGAAGLAAVAAVGGATWIQDPAGAAAPALPRAALAKVPGARVLSVEAMTAELRAWAGGGPLGVRS